MISVTFTRDNSQFFFSETASTKDVWEYLQDACSEYLPHRYFWKDEVFNEDAILLFTDDELFIFEIKKVTPIF